MQDSAALLMPMVVQTYVEALTDELIHKAWKHIREVEDLGGMAKAMETSLAQDAHRRSCCKKTSQDRFRKG